MEAEAPACVVCKRVNYGVEHKICAPCRLDSERYVADKANGAKPLVSRGDVHFTLPPFEAGMLLAVVVKERMLPSGVDEPNDPLRRCAIESCYRELTRQLRDWQTDGNEGNAT